MKKLVTILAGVVLAASFSTAAFAQAAGPTGGTLQGSGQKSDSQTGKHAAHKGIMKMVRELNLTKEQQKQVKELAIKLQMRNKDQNAKDQKATDKATKVDRQKMQERRKEFMDGLQKILTPEQNAKLKKMIEDAKSKAGDHAKGKKKNDSGGGN